MHIIGDGRGQDTAKGQVVVLDLATTALGDIWIRLELLNNTCRCTLKTSSDAAVPVLDEAAGELRTSLEEAGYGHTSVTVQLWEGERIDEVADLMRRFGGINLSA